MSATQHPFKAFINMITGWFKSDHQSDHKELLAVSQDKYNLEPRYWPEVVHFINDLNQVIASHTIDDGHISSINHRIVSYMEDQINRKGQIKDIEERYNALNVLADRIQSNSVNKLVGIKQVDSTQADFSEVIKHFKVSLAQRHNEELAHFKKHSEKH